MEKAGAVVGSGARISGKEGGGLGNIVCGKIVRKGNVEVYRKSEGQREGISSS